MIKINIKNKNDVIHGATITVLNTGSEILKTRSNEDGKAKLRVSKKNLPILIKISFVGYNPTYINFNAQLNAKIIVTMDVPYKIISEKKSISYSLKNVDCDGFYVRGGIFSKWTFFKKEE